MKPIICVAKQTAQFRTQQSSDLLNKKIFENLLSGRSKDSQILCNDTQKEIIRQVAEERNPWKL